MMKKPLQSLHKHVWTYEGRAVAGAKLQGMACYSASLATPQQNNPWACLGRRRNFILRNDKIFSQAFSCFINARLIWGKRKLAEASMVVLYAVNWQCFGTKNNFCTRVLTASLSHFPSPATVCARERREQRNSSTFTDSRAETRGL